MTRKTLNTLNWLAGMIGQSASYVVVIYGATQPDLDGIKIVLGGIFIWMVSTRLIDQAAQWADDHDSARGAGDER